MSALATRLVLVGKEEEVPFARRTIVERVRVWEGSLDEETADTIRLIVSELVSNAVVHGEGPVTITVLARPGGLLIDVRDGALDVPRPGSFGVENERGRGLALVGALAVRSGWEPFGRGKRVWAEIALLGQTVAGGDPGSQRPGEIPLRPAV
ncbi:ATP-binding protein [Streptomyces sp. SID4919]|uniref:ATP-binding protein n=1 Tax=unclassified Streptomyces TaxID=2593676 RepID=UPI000823E899|nr:MULTISPECIES: ATP-binding protein [unclassified Streptomyces]MYY08871.1 ATP-binding protein [Streptomyces sp. SID4919]SCK26017.1 Anti-sigma regulatory factor (Ser/Thr protein kinase) [Streptomyces sp. AmelKG-E11A]